jgi:hypothetical protein
MQSRDICGVPAWGVTRRGMTRRLFLCTCADVAVMPSRGSTKAAVRHPSYLQACMFGTMANIPTSFPAGSVSQQDNNMLADILRTYNIDARVFYISQSYDLQAFASRPEGKNTIYFGEAIVGTETGDSYWGDIPVRGILAHECAHLVQFASAAGVSKFRELEADFVAGFYLGVLCRKDNFDMESFISSIWGRGYVTEAKAQYSHGTPRQRAQCIRRGFEGGYQETIRTIAEAMAQSRAYAPLAARGNLGP